LDKTKSSSTSPSNRLREYIDDHELGFIIIGLVLGAIVFASIAIPGVQSEKEQLKKMDCNTIKEHLANQDYGFWLTYSNYNSQYIWRCTK